MCPIFVDSIDNLALTYLNEEFNFESELPSDFAEACTKLEK